MTVIEGEIVLEFASWLEFIRVLVGIIILTIIIDKGYRVLEATQAVPLLRGVFSLGLLYLLARFLKIEFLAWVLERSWPGLLISLAIIFQPELRRIFAQIGQTNLPLGTIRSDIQLEVILSSCEELLKKQRGALLAFPRRTGLREIIDTGTSLQSQLNKELLVSIFAYDTPLHDGCVIIQNNRLAAAGCLLPLSQKSELHIGTRHRAGLGLSENTDAVVLIVSEESRTLSLAYDAELHFNLTIKELRSELSELLAPTSKKKKRP